jgi:hypothetical protein
MIEFGRPAFRIILGTLTIAVLVSVAATTALPQAKKSPAPAAVPSAAPRPTAQGTHNQKDAPTVAAGVSGAPAGAPSAASVGGFRSARFGMNEAEVRAAIVKDFGVKSEAIKAEFNPSEQTPVLVVRAADVLPGGGIAEVSYVFGFKSKTLIQVSVAWSKAIDDKMTPDQLFSNSSILRAHFMTAGYRANTIASNMPINGGLLMFRGSDDKDHTTMLILQGTVAKGENDQRVLTPNGLVLIYTADAKTPDIYRLQPGSF